MVLAAVVVSSSADAGCVRPPLLWAEPLCRVRDGIADVIIDVIIELVLILIADVNNVGTNARRSTKPV